MRRYTALILPGMDFIKKYCRIAIPVTLQNMTSSILAALDVAIIKKLGETAIASVAIANQPAFVTNLITFGITSGGSIFLARYFGSGSNNGVKRIFTIILFFSLFLNIFITLPTLLFPGTVISMFTDIPDLIENGSKYLLISAPVFLLNGLTQAYSALFRSAGKAHYMLVSTLASLSVKTLLNFVLIYGLWGVPSLGIEGAAYATLVAYTISFTICTIFYRFFMPEDYRIKKGDLSVLNKKDILHFIKHTYPVVLNESLWGIGIASFSMIFGRMGANTVSAVNIARTLENLFNSLFHGVAISTLVVIGRSIGAGDYDDAKLDARRFAVIGLETGIFIMAVMLLFNNAYINIFFGSLSDETKALSKMIITIVALYMPARSLSSVIIMGAMRAGGDIKRAMYYDVFPIYLLSIPAGIVFGFIFKSPVYVVFTIMYSKRIVKCVYALRRLFTDRWITTIN